jgi:hypothetical protein
LTWIAAYRLQLLIEKARDDKSGYKDVQSQIESRILRSKELELIDLCYDSKKLPGFMLQLARSNVARSFAHAAMLGHSTFTMGFLRKWNSWAMVRRCCPQPRQNEPNRAN